jgi:hypothetical protein
VKGEHKTLKQKNGKAKPIATEDIFDSSISDCKLQEAKKQLKTENPLERTKYMQNFLSIQGKKQ